MNIDRYDDWRLATPDEYERDGEPRRPCSSCLEQPAMPGHHLCGSCERMAGR
jgi:hypothetical protein